MPRTIDIQFFGSAIVLSTFAAAEGAARLLDAYPATPFAWYLNIRVFGAFEAARVEGSALRHLFHPAAFEMALVLLAILLLVRVRQFRFGLALAANLSFVATLLLVNAVMRDGGIGAKSVSLQAMAVMPAGADATLATLIVASSTAFLASHVSFVHAVMRERWKKVAGTRVDETTG